MNDAFNLPATIDAPEKDEGVGYHYSAARQEQRMQGVSALYKTKHEQLACELAMGMAEPEEIFQSYGYSPEQALALTESAAFSALCKRIGDEVRESGLSFKSKMKAVSEALIPHAFEIATDPLQPATVRAKIIEWAARLAGHEPAPAKNEGAGGAGGFHLSVTFAGQAPASIVGAHVPAVIEQGAG